MQPVAQVHAVRNECVERACGEITMITRVSLGVGQSTYIWQKVIDTTRQERCKYISSDI